LVGSDTDAKQDFWIGCILANQPVFFEDGDWVRMPNDFAASVVQGKGYDLTHGEGERIWMECLARAADRPHTMARWVAPAEERGVSLIADAPIAGGYGAPAIVRPRLGQRSFRVAVLDSYGRRCAITNEKTLPVLEAAHIREYRDVQAHALDNGILFRADVHNVWHNEQRFLG
jgi:putative restriction endonuclease